MAALDRAAASARAEALRIEREHQRALLDAYRTIERALHADLNALTAALAEARAAGVEITPAILSHGRAAIPNVQALKGETYAEAAERVRQRYRALIAQTEAEIDRYGRFAATTIADGQRAAALAALGTSEAVMAAALGTPPPGIGVTFNRLPVGAIEQLVGNLGDGKPLAALLDGLGATASKAGRQALLEALGKGLSPRQAAREFRLGTNVGARRALLISRTEINRAHRAASLASFNANSDVVKSWRWTAAHGKRTCLACIARDGSEWPLSKPMPTHPACRCTMIPITKSWREIGIDIPDNRPEIETGEDWFDRQDDTTKREMMGPLAFDLFQQGKITLTDFIGERPSRRWGTSTYQRSVREILAGQEELAAD